MTDKLKESLKRDKALYESKLSIIEIDQSEITNTDDKTNAETDADSETDTNKTNIDQSNIVKSKVKPKLAKIGYTVPFTELEGDVRKYSIKMCGGLKPILSAYYDDDLKWIDRVTYSLTFKNPKDLTYTNSTTYSRIILANNRYYVKFLDELGDTVKNIKTVKTITKKDLEEAFTKVPLIMEEFVKQQNKKLVAKKFKPIPMPKELTGYIYIKGFCPTRRTRYLDD